MPTELSSFRIDKKVKKEAQKLACEMGTTLSNIINIFDSIRKRKENPFQR